MKCVFTLLLCILAELSFAQFDNLGINSKWHKGHIVLSDGEIIQGYIQNNDKLGLVNLKESLEDTVSASFQDKSIQSMEYFDNDLDKNRRFITFKINDEQSGKQRMMLLEIMMEFKHFAIASKIFSVEPAFRQRQNINYQTYYARVGYEQFEFIYILSEDGEINILQTTTVLEKSKMRPFAGKSQDFFDRDLLKKHVGQKWDQIKDYMSENNLKFNTKEGLFATLEYYGRLESLD